jgi:hypothetical protein
MRPGGRAQRARMWIDPGDAGNQPVAFSQVEFAGIDQGRNRGCGIGLAHARRQQADTVGRAMHLRILGAEAGHGDRVRQRQMRLPDAAFRPEHRDDHDFYRNGGGCLRGLPGSERQSRDGTLCQPCPQPHRIIPSADTAAILPVLSALGQELPAQPEI